jgi:hypothetical protein
MDCGHSTSLPSDPTVGSLHLLLGSSISAKSFHRALLLLLLPMHNNICVFCCPCCSLSDLTSGGVVGVSFPTNSIISCLYPSIVYAILFIFSSMLSSPTSALSGIIWKTSSSLCSSLSACCFSSSFDLHFFEDCL